MVEGSNPKNQSGETLGEPLEDMDNNGKEISDATHSTGKAAELQ